MTETSEALPDISLPNFYEERNFHAILGSLKSIIPETQGIHQDLDDLASLSLYKRKDQMWEFWRSLARLLNKVLLAPERMTERWQKEAMEIYTGQPCLCAGTLS